MPQGLGIVRIRRRLSVREGAQVEPLAVHLTTRRAQRGHAHDGQTRVPDRTVITALKQPSEVGTTPRYCNAGGTAPAPAGPTRQAARILAPSGSLRHRWRWEAALTLPPAAHPPRFAVAHVRRRRRGARLRDGERRAGLAQPLSYSTAAVAARRVTRAPHSSRNYDAFRVRPSGAPFCTRTTTP